MIKVENLTKSYGNYKAIDNISFEIEKGRIYGFLGPNGAGKSTTMNVITGYISATEGNVLINGVDIAQSPVKAKQYIGYLPEIPPLYPDMTVREYLLFVSELKKVPKSEREDAMKSAMRDTGIADVSGRLIKNLSKGYKQRVGIAQALLGNPEVIILDEPTVGLDPKQIIEIRELIRSLKEKHTVILSSHILSEVSAVCDEIIIISNGKLVAQDSPEHLESVGNGAGQSLKLLVKGNVKAVESALQGMEDIEEFTVVESDEKNLVSISITAKKDTDIREAVSIALMNAKLPILEMNVTKQTLESVFLELTQEVLVDDEDDDDDDEDDDDEEDDDKEVE